jgi:hypothetical protein
MDPGAARQAKSFALYERLIERLGYTGLGRRLRKPPLRASTVFGWGERKKVPEWREDDLDEVARQLAREEGKEPRPRGARRKKVA